MESLVNVVSVYRNTPICMTVCRSSKLFRENGHRKANLDCEKLGHNNLKTQFCVN